MVRISFIIFLVLGFSCHLWGQRLNVADTVLFSGVVINTEDSQTLPNVTCRYGQQKATLSDEMGRFWIRTFRGDTVRFTYVGFKTCVVVIPDSLYEKEYMIGVFMSPDTLMLSEALIMRRFGDIKRQNLINAKNNMTGILRQAYAPVKEMDASMNQQMMINEYARSVEMKGHVDVRLGVGTQSIDAFKLLRMRKRVNERQEWLDSGEVDLLKRVFYLEKKKKQDN